MASHSHCCKFITIQDLRANSMRLPTGFYNNFLSAKLRKKVQKTIDDGVPVALPIIDADGIMNTSLDFTFSRKLRAAKNYEYYLGGAWRNYAEAKRLEVDSLLVFSWKKNKITVKSGLLSWVSLFNYDAAFNQKSRTPRKYFIPAPKSSGCRVYKFKFFCGAIKVAGNVGISTVTDGENLNNELGGVEGMRLAAGYISANFVTDEKTQKCELEQPVVVIHEKKISDAEPLHGPLDLAIMVLQ